MRKFLLFMAFAAMSSYTHAAYEEEEIISTAPIGSSFYRHLARETNIDLRELVKFEKRGFGRTEICILILISTESVQTLKDNGNKRLKEQTPLKVLVKDANMDFDKVYAQARELKTRIEAMGDENLPEAIYEVAQSTPTETPKKKKKKEDSIDEPVKPLEPDN
jgi:hypothetical protein